jgi:peptidoglycan hydrolase-like amidase
VEAPCDAERGYTLWGHGVGMSATEALCMASKGEQWDSILHHFYTNIELFQRWKK